MKPIKIKVTATGVTFLYNDRIPLHPFGSVEIRRASNVEWDQGKGGWTVELADGTCLPGSWIKREDALKAEVEWLHARL